MNHSILLLNKRKAIDFDSTSVSWTQPYSTWRGGNRWREVNRTLPNFIHSFIPFIHSGRPIVIYFFWKWKMLSILKTKQWRVHWRFRPKRLLLLFIGSLTWQLYNRRIDDDWINNNEGLSICFSVTTHEHWGHIGRLFFVRVRDSYLPVCDGTFSAEIHKHPHTGNILQLLAS